MSSALMTRLRSFYEPLRNEDQARDMARYMRDRFPFLGIKTPERRQRLRSFLSEHSVAREQVRDLVRQLWELPEREYHYVGLDLLDRFVKPYRQDDIVLLEFLITHKSWWDTVDWIASRHVGGYMAAHQGPGSMESLERWTHGDNMWLQRSAIIFQLKYKDETDEALLYDFIRRHLDSPEFFIQKAIGWALREYAKTAPESVVAFVESHDLPALSRREALKRLER